MLSAASIGMFFYGLYATGTAVVDLIGPRTLEIWADLLQLALGLILMLAAAFVRVLVPGGLAMALGALFGLQALALHAAAHVSGRVAPEPQVARGLFAALLVLLAYGGARRARRGAERV